MRSAGFTKRTPAQSVALTFTEGESSFRNAKLSDLALVAYKTLADTAGKGSVFFITIVAARRLSPWEFGAFGLGTTIGWMLSVATDFGVQMHLARVVARAPHAAPSLLRAWWRVRLATTALGVIGLVAALSAFGVGARLAVPIALFAAVYLVTGLVELLNYFYRGLSRTDIESTLTIGQRTVTLGFALAALAWGPDVNVLAAAMLVPAIGTLAWSWIYAHRASARLADHVWTDATDRPRDRFFRDVFPIGAGIVLSALYFRLDVVLVELWAGTEAVARYNTVFRLVDALRLVPAAALAVVLPALCRADDLGPLVRVASAVTVFGVVVSALVWLAAERLLSIVFGATYSSAAPAFRVLALSFPLLCLNFALTHQLVAWNRQRTYAGICAAALLVNLALNAWLIPALSIEGAAWATLGTELCVTAGCVATLSGRS